jgi:hypothetical protein
VYLNDSYKESQVLVNRPYNKQTRKAIQTKAKSSLSSKNATITGSSSIFGVHGTEVRGWFDNDSGHLEKLLIGSELMTKKRKYKTSAMGPRGARRLPDSCPALLCFDSKGGICFRDTVGNCTTTVLRCKKSLNRHVIEHRIMYNDELEYLSVESKDFLWNPFNHYVRIIQDKKTVIHGGMHNILMSTIQL